MQHRESKSGLLLVGHGTRDTVGVSEFLSLAAQVEARSGVLVEPCFLEIAEPSIAGGLARLAERGAREIIVVPVLLFAAGHAKRDIPAAVVAAAARFPSINTRQTPVLECHPRILDLSERKFTEAVAGREPVPSSDTILLMVGRGSFDPHATAAMHRFAALRAERSAGVPVETCFVAMQTPALAPTLERLAAAHHRRVVVQPHLLFRGELLEDIADQIASIAATAPATEWLLTAPLGAEPELVAAVMDLAALVRQDLSITPVLPHA